MMLEHGIASRIGSNNQLFSEHLISGSEDLAITEKKSCCVAETSTVEEQQVVEEVVAAAEAVKEQVYRDPLVGATQATRKFVEACNELTSQFRRSTAYKYVQNVLPLRTP